MENWWCKNFNKTRCRPCWVPVSQHCFVLSGQKTGTNFIKMALLILARQPIESFKTSKILSLDPTTLHLLDHNIVCCQVYNASRSKSSSIGFPHINIYPPCIATKVALEDDLQLKSWCLVDELFFKKKSLPFVCSQFHPEGGTLSLQHGPCHGTCSLSLNFLFLLFI